MVKRYQWHSEELKKKSQVYDWLMVVCGVLVLAVYFIGRPSEALLVLLVGAVVFYMLSWWIRNRDAKLKAKTK